jgi:hypothetical protein
MFQYRRAERARATAYVQPPFVLENLAMKEILERPGGSIGRHTAHRDPRVPNCQRLVRAPS